MDNTDWTAIKEKKEEFYNALPANVKTKYEVSGIYKITINGQLAYVGKSTNCLNRWIAHKINTLHDFKQHDFYEVKYEILRRAYQKNYTISCEIIEECGEEDLAARERYWIQELNPPLNGGNALVTTRGWLFFCELEA